MYRIILRSLLVWIMTLLPLMVGASGSTEFKPMVRLEPQMRVQDKHPASDLNQSLLLPYLEFHRLITEHELRHAVRVLGASNGKQYLSGEEVVYISGQHSQLEWVIFHPQHRFMRGEHQVTVLKPVAWAKQTTATEQFTGLSLTKQLQEIMVDDIALPLNDNHATEPSLVFYPQPAPSHLEPTILGSINGTHYAAKNQIVVLDRGSDDGLAQGNSFRLFEPGKSVKPLAQQSAQVEIAAQHQWQLPDHSVGSLMVIRTYPYFSLAIVTESQRQIGRRTLVKAPVITNE